MLSLEHLTQLLERHRPQDGRRIHEFRLGNKTFRFNQRPYLMGVINLSTDSWYRESVCLTLESALERAEILRAQGADIIDVGAESTIPTAHRLKAENQKKQLRPLIEVLVKKRFIVSVETYSLPVARMAVEAGAKVLNLTSSDQSGEFFRMAAAHDAAVILCYVQGKNVRNAGNFDFSRDPIEAMRDYFARKIELAHRCGLRKLIIDPGLGFYYRNLGDSAQRVRHQMNVFLNTFRLRSLGHPVCHALPHAFEFFKEEVRVAEPFFAVLAALGKTNLFRTHEIPKVKAVLDTLQLWK